MLCEECQTEPATVHVTRIVNNQKSEINLCAKCARERGEAAITLEPGFEFHNILAGLFEPDSSLMPSSPVRRSPVRCSHCGMSLADFRRSGQLGCSHCYTQFQRELEPMLKRVHRSVEHAGKAPPGRFDERRRTRRELDRLKEQLRQAVAEEAYEDAARIRDEIRRLQVELEKEPS